MIRKTLLLLLLAVAAGNAGATVIQSIEIQGLEKTKPSTVKNIIGYREGDPISLGSEEEIRQKLVKSGLFVNETIDVRLESADEQATLTIILNDRFTLIPIPIFSYSDEGMTGGLFVAESNVFGFGHQLYTGAMYSPDRQMFMLGYSNPTFLGGPYELGGNMGIFNYETTIVSIDGDTDLSEYDVTSVDAGIRWGWDLEPFSLEVGAYGTYASTSLSDDDIFGFIPEARLEYDTLFYDTYFTEGMKIGLAYEMMSYTGGFDFTQHVKTDLTYQMLLGERWQLQFNADGGVSWGDELQSMSLHHGACRSILPEGVLADRFAQANMKLQFAAFDFNWGYLAFPVAYQAGVMDGISGDDEFFHGPAAGMSLYLKKVAIPALSLEYARNMETGTGVFKFNLGLEM